MRRGDTFERSSDWVREVQRIALLPSDIGEAIDELGLCFYQARQRVPRAPAGPIDTRSW